ncbi:MurR/RpiR family transcriptional regulator [Pseudochelatococcus contaminans]|uniref:DNA-binding MurR/RpiR family transcriptional regulator n=1 Tax=Pseudochelatococcus contaminans TaxID=1538103 RepID=A0A7W5Z1W4_9HYPH|nr:MurR/RpiR family transcriptional regulator [Pseudochelatococcus contaminans]MBB3808335.1 DNA-binding MurR/RpiR family transcriptional regulator [Pseudochelatococcus contaminans]
MSQQPGFIERVRAALGDLHPAERRLAEFLLDFPGELASYDAQELARLSSVSKATVSRFVRRLGFDNYDQARRAAREESNASSRLYQAHSNGNDGMDQAGQIEEERANLEWTFQQNPPEELDGLARRLLEARKVWVIGERIGHSFASYLAWQLRPFVRDIVVAPQSGETLGEHIAAMGDGDCVVMFALRRCVAGSKAVIGAIRETGAAIALITDESASVRQQTDWHLQCRTRTSATLLNHASVLAICHQIVTRVSMYGHVGAGEQQRRIDAINEAIGALQEQRPLIFVPDASRPDS